MGACASRSVVSRTSSQQQDAPMWVLQMAHVLEMRKFLPHQILKAEGLLVEWTPAMSSIFVSHQWLAREHPDPDGVQLGVLQGILKKLLSKQLKIELDIVSQFWGGTMKQDVLDRIGEGLGEGYLWMDYFSVPQLLGEDLADDQLLYVWSIPSYIDYCDAFVALVPSTIHHDTGQACSLHSWLQRGWCRTELWCKCLSARDIPMVVVKSDDLSMTTIPLWYRYPVYSAHFAVEKDRDLCRGVVTKALCKYIKDVKRKNKTAYRLYLSLFQDFTGLDSKHRGIEEFRVDFGFSKALGRYKGLGPIACAALSGDARLIRCLADAKAAVHSRAPRLPEVFNLPDFTPLHLATAFSKEIDVLKTLLEIRADPNDSTMNAPPPLTCCKSAAAVDLLVRHGAGVNFQGKHITQQRPIHFVSAVGAPCEVVARLLELRADVHGGSGGLAGQSPLHSIAFSGDSSNDLMNAQLLLQKAADVNQSCQPQGVFRVLELMTRAYSQCVRKPGAVVRVTSNQSTTALGSCALLNNEGLLVFLLRARADPEIRNNRGLRAIDMTSSQRIRAILTQDSNDQSRRSTFFEAFASSFTERLQGSSFLQSFLRFRLL